MDIARLEHRSPLDLQSGRIDPTPDLALLRRIQGEFLEMPCLRLTEAQAQRFLGVDRDTCADVIETLIDRKFLRRTPTGVLVRVDDAAPRARRVAG